MPQRNWDKIADHEFEAMDKEWQNDWSDLRHRVR